MGKKTEIKRKWINPVGGLGDTLMLSGVLKLHFDLYPEIKFNLVRRKGYVEMLKGHPAIELIGFPPKNAEIITSDYWAREKIGGGNQRAFQIIARIFGLKTPVEEKLFFPGTLKGDDLLFNFIPWKEKNVILAPSSESPRKEMHPFQWQQVVERLVEKDIFVIQAGKEREFHIRNTYSLTGVTSPSELINLMQKVNLVMSADNFVMHAAHLVGIPAIVTWGPTGSHIYGYKEHIHIEAPLDHCEFRNSCLGAAYPQNYTRPCPLGKDHCMNKISPDMIYNNAMGILY